MYSEYRSGRALRHAARLVHSDRHVSRVIRWPFSRRRQRFCEIRILQRQQVIREHVDRLPEIQPPFAVRCWTIIRQILLLQNRRERRRPAAVLGAQAADPDRAPLSACSRGSALIRDDRNSQRPLACHRRRCRCNLVREHNRIVDCQVRRPEPERRSELLRRYRVGTRRRLRVCERAHPVRAA